VTTRGIIMGIGAPNICRDGRKTMCSILLCEDLGFIRIYPIPATETWPLWATVEVDIERSQSDTRNESYRLTAYRFAEPPTKDRQRKRDLLEQCVLRSGADDPIQYMNAQRGSIALVKLSWDGLVPSFNHRIPSVGESDEEFSWIKAQGEHWQKPYLQWTSEQGAGHTTHLVGREIYMGLLNNPTRPWDIFNNIEISNPDYEHWLLLGNMKDKRNVWVGVHLHRLKKQTVGSIPTSFMTVDGRPEGWPYCRQEEANVPVVDNQPLLFTTDIMTSTNNHGNTLTAA
jgi:hypothetical protein